MRPAAPVGFQSVGNVRLQRHHRATLHTPLPHRPDQLQLHLHAQKHSGNDGHLRQPLDLQ